MCTVLGSAAASPAMRTTHARCRRKFAPDSSSSYRPSVVGSRRLLTEHRTPGCGGRARGGHALSREVHPPEDRGAAAGAAGVPGGDLGLRHVHHRPRGQTAARRRQTSSTRSATRPRTPSTPLQRERRQILVYLADPRGADALDRPAQAAGSATDEAVAEIRRERQDPDVRDATWPRTPTTASTPPGGASTASARCAAGRAQHRHPRPGPRGSTTTSSTPATRSSAPSTAWRTSSWTSRAAPSSASPAPASTSPARTP